MDLATTIGFFGGIAAVVGTMLTGGHIMPFVSLHGFTIVFVGGFFAVMYTAPMPVFLASFKAMGTAFKQQGTSGNIAALAAHIGAFARYGISGNRHQLPQSPTLLLGHHALPPGGNESAGKYTAGAPG